MNDNTKVRVRISKQLFESLSKEIVEEVKKSKGGDTHAMKMSSKMPRLGENKQMMKAKKAKKEETKKKVTEIAKKQLAEMMKKKK